MGLNKLPHELLVQIVSYSLPWPARLNLRNVDISHRRIIDSYFHNVGDVDVDRYLKLNTNFDICEQLQYIIRECGKKTVSGFIMPSTFFYNPTLEDITKLVFAIRQILVNHADKLETFKLDCLYPFLPLQSARALKDVIKQVIDQAVNLKKLELICYSIENTFSIDLSNQKKLKCLRGGDALSFKNCPDGLVEFDQADFFTERLTTLSILRKDAYQFQRTLMGSCATLQSLSLVNTQFYDQTPTLVLKFPSLKSLYVSCTRNLNVEIDISNSAELNEVSMLGMNGVNITGFNPQLHRFKQLLWYGGNMSLPIQLLSHQESRSDLEELSITIESFALINVTYDKTLKALSYGCPKLKRVQIRTTEECFNTGVQLSCLIRSNKMLRMVGLDELAIDKFDLINTVLIKATDKTSILLIVGRVNCTRQKFSKELLKALSHQQVPKREDAFRVTAQWYSSHGSCLRFRDFSCKLEDKYGIIIYG